MEGIRTGRGERTLEGEGCWRARRPESGEERRDEGEVTWEEEAESNTVRRKMPGYLYLPQCLRERDRVSLPLVLLWRRQCRVAV
jgi:hypothetical protein